jgi:hypothetical protein
MTQWIEAYAFTIGAAGVLLAPVLYLVAELFDDQEDL